ncbi:conserved hypothetical protein [Burkholderiales bacterium]|nr:conserved hypothetical protein [Burkholderiales bacterium]
MNDNATLIDACKYLYLRVLEEPEDNALRLVIEEVNVGELAEVRAPDDESVTPLRGGGTRTIEHGPGCRVFEVSWPIYIAYSVRNESYARPESKGNGKGRVFIKHTASSYLDYLCASTIACDIFPAIFPRPIWHWAIGCVNHAVDVASIYEPDITVRTTA